MMYCIVVLETINTMLHICGIPYTGVTGLSATSRLDRIGATTCEAAKVDPRSEKC